MKSPVFVSTQPQSFSQATFDSIVPIGNQETVELIWMLLVWLNNDRTVQESRQYNYQLLDVQNNVLFDSAGNFFPNNNFIMQVTTAASVFPLLVNAVSSPNQLFPSPYLIPPKSSFRFYDSRQVAGTSDQIEIQSALFTA